MRRSLVAVTAILVSMLTACVLEPTPTVTASSTPTETPLSPTTSPVVPTVRGANGSLGVVSGFWLMSPDQAHDADCNTLTFDMSDAEQKQVLAAIGGDTAFQFNKQSGHGDGWIICGVFPNDAASFTTGFTVIFDATAGHTADGQRVGSPPLAIVAVAP